MYKHSSSCWLRRKLVGIFLSLHSLLETGRVALPTTNNTRNALQRLLTFWDAAAEAVEVCERQNDEVQTASDRKKSTWKRCFVETTATSNALLQRREGYATWGCCIWYVCSWVDCPSSHSFPAKTRSKCIADRFFIVRLRQCSDFFRPVTWLDLR